MLTLLLNKMDRIGRIILFGSLIQKSDGKIGDIDIALVVPSGRLKDLREVLKEVIEQSGLWEYVLLQDLLVYDKKGNGDRRSEQVFHILICEEGDLETNNSIIVAVKSGIEIKVSEAA